MAINNVALWVLVGRSKGFSSPQEPSDGHNPQKHNDDENSIVHIQTGQGSRLGSLYSRVVISIIFTCAANSERMRTYKCNRENKKAVADSDHANGIGEVTKIPARAVWEKPSAG